MSKPTTFSQCDLRAFADKIIRDLCASSLNVRIINMQAGVKTVYDSLVEILPTAAEEAEQP